MNTVTPFVVLTGSSFKPAIVLGELFKDTAYSDSSNFVVPDGSIKFCRLIALTTSDGPNPLDCNSLLLISTDTTLIFPP